MRNYNEERSLLFVHFLSLKLHLDYVLTFLAVSKGKQLPKKKSVFIVIRKKRHSDSCVRNRVVKREAQSFVV